ncbi:transglycosylase SLT domain-containing protein [Nocardia fluminea]|uniref:Transglycosylase-like protein with SLT domain n=1 Tax=Nocardia fluminea TaxID=134984 RepID=A0A2N3V6X8_9NOCA|nr:transglycosylase SLT domain-containing protein [Nocardia fluminea]PKV77385.1 transglycosylase-like protein with SLT domain [Nocardia fluminea]
MLNKDKLSTVIGRRSRREAFTVAVAAVGLVAVAASSAVSFADDSVPERAAMVVEQAENIPAPAAPAIQAIPAPAPAPEAAPAPAPAPAPEAAPAPMPQPAPKAYSNDLHGWISEALDIMAAKGIPGSYEGIYRNIMRESTGNPQAINLWDINAINGIPSKGLLQVIDPTFAAYHVEGTAFDVWNPVSNIVAACNYAAQRYGSMDNVNSAY